MTTLEVITEVGPGGVHLRLLGELDLASAKELKAALERVQAEAPPRTVVDLRGLGFIDSTGLSALVGADERAREAGRRLLLVRGPAPVQRVFEITGLDRRFTMVDDPESSAVAGATRGAGSPP
jgi:anti-anti-sigma factor